MPNLPKPVRKIPSVPPTKAQIVKTLATLEQQVQIYEVRLAEVQTELKEVAKTAHDIVVTKRILTATVAILAPLIVVGVVTVAQSMARQEAIQKDVDLQRSHVTQLEQDVKGLRIDMGAIRGLNEGIRRDSARILDKLEKMEKPRRRRR